jgi:hypothetical protein
LSPAAHFTAAKLGVAAKTSLTEGSIHALGRER